MTKLILKQIYIKCYNCYKQVIGDSENKKQKVFLFAEIQNYAKQQWSHNQI